MGAHAGRLPADLALDAEAHADRRGDGDPRDQLGFDDQDLGAAPGTGRGSCPATMPARARSVSQPPSGSKAEGEAPGWLRAMRTRSTAGWMRKRSGGVEHQGLAIDARRHRAVRVDLERRAPSTLATGARRAAVRRARRRADDGDAEQAVVDPRARARADRAAEPVAVVGDQHRGARAVLVAARARPAQVGASPSGPEHVGHGVQQRAQLRVAVARRAGRPRRRGRARRC